MINSKIINLNNILVTSLMTKKLAIIDPISSIRSRFSLISASIFIFIKIKKKYINHLNIINGYNKSFLRQGVHF